ncbi:MAG: tetratricopeptide repeat protein, partial [Bradymonadia bacterium]
MDKNKASAAAQKYLQRGQIDKAIREYETIVQADPDDVRTWLKIGDLHSRNGKVALAVSTYRKVAETYQGKGFFLKAVAVYKKVLDVDPTLTEVYRTLGDVYVKLNLTAEALTQYRLVVGSYERDGRSADAMLLLEEMVELVPDDESNHLRLAEAHAKNCHDQPAIDHFKFVLSRMRKSGRHSEFIKVAERLLYLYPDDSDSVRHLAQAYLATGNTKRALGWLQKLFKQDPSDSRTLALLAETFSQIGRGEKAVAVLRELARIHEQNGDIGKQRKAIERLLELAPHDDVARDALARLNAAHGQGTETDAALLGTDTNFSAGLSVEQRLQMCLSDADLLVKYGLAEHARERVKVAMTLDKSEPKVWLKMRELCVASGDQSGVADACTAAAQLLQDS